MTMPLDRPSACRIAMIAHDNKKADLTEWARYNLAILARHDLCATGTTGRLLQAELGLPVTCMRSGPLGGDQILVPHRCMGYGKFQDAVEQHPSAA